MKIIAKASLASFVIFAILGSFALPARADLAATDADLSVAITPEKPGAFQDVTVTISSYSTDLTRATIRWTVNGKVVLSGMGKKELTTTTGSVGSSTNIIADIILSDGTPITKQIILAPAEVDLLWEAPDSYVPPFYRGKALPASEAKLRFVAIPSINAGLGSNPANFVYAWKRNYTTVANDSEGAPNALSFSMSYLNNSETVRVDATTIDNSTAAESQITIMPTKPKILFYENNPAMGILYNKNLTTSFSLSGTEGSIIAEPFSFSPRDSGSSALQYVWAINDKRITTPENKNTLVLHSDGTSEGTASISLDIIHLAKLFQKAGASMTVQIHKK